MEGPGVRLKIREDRCAGQGCCAGAAPNVFQLDDEGFAVHRGQEFDIAAGDEEDARRGALSCPETAIEIISE